MTLHLNEQERAAYDREKSRQRKEAYRQRQADKVWARERRYEQIEATIAEVREENQRIKSGYERLRQQFEELQSAPPKERIVEIKLAPDPVMPGHIQTIGNIVKFLLDCRNNPELLERAFEEIRPFDPRREQP